MKSGTVSGDGPGVRMTRRASIPALALVAALAACEADENANTVEGAEGDPSNLLFEPPVQLLAARAIVEENLELEIRAGGRVIDATRQEDGRWGGTLSLPENEPVTVRLDWFELVDGRRLPLARAEREFTPSFGGGTELLVESRFFDSSNLTLFDADSDGASNLDERAEGTDAFDRGSSPMVVLVPLDVRLELPGAIGSAGAAIVAAVNPIATVNGQPLALAREGDVWRGNASVRRDGRATLDVVFFDDAAEGLRLAERTFSFEVSGNTPSVVFGASDYLIENSDGDELTNIEELVAGTDASDPGDPPRPPCEVSQFAAGCDSDTDDDGFTDSQETANADRDRDGIPDYRESRLVDADNDGLSEESDIADDDPCVPSTDNAACRGTDTGGAGTGGTDGGTDTSGTDTGTDTGGADTSGTDTGTDTGGADTSGTDTGTDTGGADTSGTDTGTDADRGGGAGEGCHGDGDGGRRRSRGGARGRCRHGGTGGRRHDGRAGDRQRDTRTRTRG